LSINKGPGETVQGVREANGDQGETLGMVLTRLTDKAIKHRAWMCAIQTTHNVF